MPRDLRHGEPGQVLVHFADQPTFDRLAVALAHFAQRLWRCDDDDVLHPAAEREVAEQIGGVLGKLVLVDLVPIGLLDGTPPNTRAAVRMPRPLGALIVRGRVLLGLMLDDD